MARWSGDAIGWHEVDWLRDINGTAHALRESDYPHHITFCGRYMRGGDFLKPHNLYGTCINCRKRLSEPHIRGEGEPVPRTILLGRGIGDRHHNGKSVTE